MRGLCGQRGTGGLSQFRAMTGGVIGRDTELAAVHGFTDAPAGTEAISPALESLIRSRLAWNARFRVGFERSLEHARTALALADELDSGSSRR